MIGTREKDHLISDDEPGALDSGSLVQAVPPIADIRSLCLEAQGS